VKGNARERERERKKKSEREKKRRDGERETQTDRHRERERERERAGARERERARAVRGEHPCPALDELIREDSVLLHKAPAYQNTKGTWTDQSSGNFMG
jgi:hypothetical protein